MLSGRDTNHAMAVATWHPTLSEGCTVDRVDCPHRLHELLQRAAKSKLDWNFEPAGARFIWGKDGRAVVRANEINMSTMANETTEVMKCNTEFIEHSSIIVT